MPNITTNHATTYTNLHIKYCIPEIKYHNILYTQKLWLTLIKIDERTSTIKSLKILIFSTPLKDSLLQCSCLLQVFFSVSFLASIAPVGRLFSLVIVLETKLF